MPVVRCRRVPFAIAREAEEVALPDSGAFAQQTLAGRGRSGLGLDGQSLVRDAIGPRIGALQ